MGINHNLENLKAAVLPLSRAKDWDVARLEWLLVGTTELEEAVTCPCGHFPVIVLCHLRNQWTGAELDVGSICVRRFINPELGTVIDGIRRVAADPRAALNFAGIEYFEDRELFTKREADFLWDTALKRRLSVNQAKWRRSLNLRLLLAVARRGFRGDGDPGGKPNGPAHTGRPAP